MITLTKEQVLMLHEQLIETTGGSKGIRDEGMLDSALSNSFQSFGGDKMARRSYSIGNAPICGYGVPKY